jgi:hypothetical protein
MKGRIQSIAQNYDIDALGCFANGLIAAASTKLDHDLPLMLEYPDICVHTIHQSLKFDEEIREICAGAKSISQILYNDSVYFDIWIQNELNCNFYLFMLDGMNKLESITSEKDAWTILDQTSDYISISSCSSIIEVIELITDEYSGIQDITKRKQFFNETQLSILEAYLDIIKTKIADLMNEFRPVPIIFEDTCRRITEFCLYLCALEQMCIWIRLWSGDMVRIFQIEY